MDQDETTTEITEATAAHVDEVLDDEPKRGKVLQTFLVRLTLRANDDGTEGAIPTNERLADVIETAVHQQIEDFDRDAINASAEKV